MEIAEIIAAIKSGKTVYWRNNSYEVIIRNGSLKVKHYSNDRLIDVADSLLNTEDFFISSDSL